MLPVYQGRAAAGPWAALSLPFMITEGFWGAGTPKVSAIMKGPAGYPAGPGGCAAWA